MAAEEVGIGAQNGGVIRGALDRLRKQVGSLTSLALGFQLSRFARKITLGRVLRLCFPKLEDAPRTQPKRPENK